MAEIASRLLSLAYVYDDFARRHHGYENRDFSSRAAALKWLGRNSWLTCINGPPFSHYFILVPLSDNRDRKHANEKRIIG